MGPHNANVFCISSIPHLQVTSTVKKGKIYQVIQDSNKKLEFKLNCMSLLLILEKKFNPKNVTVVQATVNCFLVSASWGLPQRMWAGGSSLSSLVPRLPYQDNDWSVQIIELVPAHAFGTLEISPQASYYLPGSPNSIILFQSRGAWARGYSLSLSHYDYIILCNEH